ncbi:uncharacterized protein RCC_09743 [Ramularia collo-cygni]|uniref:Guanine nucleotide-binding protein n=1 Tax=Ramularia collo-cygni TaxID=112498 RepID=A0A2D3V3R7_9PEZI|nr:uncharacterized protein RCC_09743 [Ramularia collo-cygni]CZT24026.1 uncharacterized protein RCC_09743 [Ramularia collo-cygni]
MAFASECCKYTFPQSNGLPFNSNVMPSAIDAAPQHIDSGVKCVASTGAVFHCPVPTTRKDGVPISNLFRHAKFTADGTSLITHNEDNRLRTYVLPTDLLDEQEQPHALTEHSSFRSASNIQSYALYPGFDLQDTSTTLALCGSAFVPISLKNVLQYDIIHATYPLINEKTEAHLPPRSLLFTRNGSHFIAGSENALAAFDCSRDGSGPLFLHQLKPGRKAPQNSLQAQRRGAVSALAISADGVLALGTTLREVALYEQEGLGQCASVFSLESGVGTGVTSVDWSPCGKYLLVAERQSDVFQVYDIRDTHQKVTTLIGRNANTTQTLNIDVIPTATGYELWGGGLDGKVRMWRNPGSIENDVGPDAAFKIADAPVSSTAWHPSGAVLATSSGRRLAHSLASDGSDSEDEDDANISALPSSLPDNTLRVWTLRD